MNPIPDFSLPPWRKNEFCDLQSEDGEIIGICRGYINEQTGKLGVRILINGSKDMAMLWEESLCLGEREVSLKYIAYAERSVWRKVRINFLYPSRTEVRDDSGRRSVCLYFSLVTKGELPVQFSIRI